MNNICIEIAEESSLATIKMNYNNVNVVKNVYINDVIKMLEDSKSVISTKNKKNSSVLIEDDDLNRIYPNYNVSVINIVEVEDKKIVVLKKNKYQSDLIYYKNKFENVGIPTTIFYILLNSQNTIYEAFAFALKEEYVGENTKLYRYPFPNTHGNGSICFGGNRAHLHFKTIHSLNSFPDKFLAMPFTGELYKAGNSVDFNFREVMEYLENNTFDNDLLVGSGYTHKEFMNKVVRRNI